ncbi:hypothetical protein M419DRAFT_91116, partial [Trichoderma reesei RUT C-30]
ESNLTSHPRLRRCTRPCQDNDHVSGTSCIRRTSTATKHDFAAASDPVRLTTMPKDDAAAVHQDALPVCHTGGLPAAPSPAGLTGMSSSQLVLGH